MSRKPRPRPPHAASEVSRAATTPMRATVARWTLLSRGGSRSSRSTRQPVPITINAGARTASEMGGAGITGAPRWPWTGPARSALRPSLPWPREDRGIDADPDDEEHERPDERPLADAQVAQPAVLLVRHLTEDHPLVHPQEVHG